MAGEAEVLIIGGGAIGGVLASLLAREVGRLVILDPAVEHAARMRDPGLRVDSPAGDRTVALDARTDPAQLDGRFDFALVTVKASALEPALTPLVDAGIDNFVSLGNGMVQDRVAAIVGADRAMAGIIEWGATNLGPGHVSRTSIGPIVVGELDGAVRPRTEDFVARLGALGELELSTNLRGAIWTKLLVNSTFAALGAVSGLTTGDVVAAADGRRAARALWREGFEAAAASGIRLEPIFGASAADLVDSEVGADAAEANMRAALAGVGATKASMLQDLEAGRLTEVDVINGAVVAAGDAAAVPTPAQRRAVDLVHAIERGEAASEPANLTAVADAVS
jgi:2-dehydropantoate 2-reductase